MIKIYVTTYTLDNGVTIVNQSHNNSKPQYSLGETVKSKIFEGDDFYERSGTVVEINKKLDILSEGCGIFAFYNMEINGGNLV